MIKTLTFLPIAMNNDFLPDELIMNYWQFKGVLIYDKVETLHTQVSHVK